MAEPESEATRIFGERVRARRKELGWTQEQLAEASGLHWTYIGQTERGERNVTLKTICAIAGGLNVDPSDLVSELSWRG